MITVATPHAGRAKLHGSESTLKNAIDRWIYVFMAAFFIVIALAGFVPDSLAKIEAIEMGERPPFPVVLHVHSVLMGSFLLLLLAQTILAANGKLEYHQRLGVTAAVLAPAIVIARFIDNIMLIQIRVGILFSLFILIAFIARKSDSGLHKRMMFLAIAPALPAAFDRMTWLPHTLPESPLSPDFYVLLAVAPMLI